MFQTLRVGCGLNVSSPLWSLASNFTFSPEVKMQDLESGLSLELCQGSFPTLLSCALLL